MQIKEEYLLKLKQLKEDYENLIISLGQISVQKAQLEMDEKSLQNDYFKKGQEEQELLQKIQVEYGDGNLDLATGEFTPKQ